MASSEPTLGSRIRLARERAGLSTLALAQRLGRTLSYLNDIERDARIPGEDLVEQIAHELRIDAGTLLDPGEATARTARHLERQLEQRAPLRELVQAMVDLDLSDKQIAEILAFVRDIGRRC